MPESETLLRKSNVPENDAYKGEHNEVGEAIVGPSSVDMNPTPCKHIPTTSVTAMMILWATMDQKYQGINLQWLFILET